MTNPKRHNGTLVRFDFSASYYDKVPAFLKLCEGTTVKFIDGSKDVLEACAEGARQNTIRVSLRIYKSSDIAKVLKWLDDELHIAPALNAKNKFERLK